MPDSLYSTNKGRRIERRVSGFGGRNMAMPRSTASRDDEGAGGERRNGGMKRARPQFKKTLNI